IFHDFNQLIRSQMRLLDIENLLRRSCPDENIQHFCIPTLAVFYQSIQFSVGKGSGASFSKLNVALRIQFSCFPELVYFFHPPVCIIPPFQKDWAQSCTNQIISAEKSCTSASYDHWPADPRII